VVAAAGNPAAATAFAVATSHAFDGRALVDAGLDVAENALGLGDDGADVDAWVGAAADLQFRDRRSQLLDEGAVNAVLDEDA